MQTKTNFSEISGNFNNTDMDNMLDMLIDIGFAGIK